MTGIVENEWRRMKIEMNHKDTKTQSRKNSAWLYSAPFILFIAFTITARAADKIPLLIIDGQNNHDWPRATVYLKSILEGSNLFTVSVSTTPPKGSPLEAWNAWHPNFSNYAVVLSNFNSGYKPTDDRWPRDVEIAFEKYISSGHGLVVYHAANNAFHDWQAWNDMIALGWREPPFGPSITIDTSPDHSPTTREIPAGEGLKPGHPKEHDFTISLFDPTHPITKDLPQSWLHLHEQLTHGQHGPARNIHILTYAYADDTHENEPMDWTTSYGAGRVYVTMQGHLWKDGPDTTLRCPAFQTLLIRGAEWAATGKVSYPVPTDFPTEKESHLRPAPTTQPSTNYILDFTTPVDPALQSKLEKIDTDLRAKFGMTPAHTAIGLYDLLTGRVAMLNPDREIYAASVAKVGILLAYFQLRPEAATNLDPTTKHELGLMAKASSNEMASKFSHQLTLPAIQKVLGDYHFYDKDHGGGIWVGKHYGKDAEKHMSPVGDNSHAATVRQLLRYYLMLEQGQLVSPQACETMKQIFASPDIPFDDIKFVKGLKGRDVTFYRKWGTWENWLHDTAVVTGPARHYILVALTEHPQGDAYLEQLAPTVDDLMRGQAAHSLIPSP